MACTSYHIKLLFGIGAIRYVQGPLLTGLRKVLLDRNYFYS